MIQRMHTGPRRPGALLAAAVLCLALLAGTAAGPARAQQPETADGVVDESFSIRLDPELYQLEEAISLIAGSLTKVQDRVATLAINSFYFGKGVSADFRRKAEVVILDRLFEYNPNIRLVQCQECQKLETRISRGVLHLRKGMPSSDARKALADKLQVDGFIDIGMFKDDGQLTVYLKVVEAQTGAIILVDELAGRRAPQRRALTFSFGEMVFPISAAGTTVDHKALLLGVQESVKLTGRFSFAVDLIFFTDKNENNPETTLKLDTGALLAPTLGFDVLQIPASTSRLVYFLGLGKLLSPQLDYANLWRTGLEFIVGDSISVLFGYNSFLEANVDTGSTTSTVPVTLEGGGYEIRFGYRF